MRGYYEGGILCTDMVHFMAMATVLMALVVFTAVPGDAAHQAMAFSVEIVSTEALVSVIALTKITMQALAHFLLTAITKTGSIDNALDDKMKDNCTYITVGVNLPL